MVKTQPAVRETWVQSLGGEDPLEEGTATHSSILAWRIPRTEEPGRATVHGVAKESDMTQQLNNNNNNALFGYTGLYPGLQIL